MKNNLAIVSLYAGLSTRILKAPKALVKLDSGESILNRQLRLLNKVFHKPDIYITVGYKKDSIIESAEEGKITWIENQHFENTNVAHSIGLALQKVPEKQDVLIVYGDLVYSEETLKNIPFASGTHLLIDDSGRDLMKKDEVGMNLVDSQVVSMSYNVKPKWSQIAFIQKEHRPKVDEHFQKESNGRFFGYEVINQLVEKVPFKGINSDNICEIDSYKDLKRANKFIVQKYN